jgi:hypothetical protein
VASHVPGVVLIPTGYIRVSTARQYLVSFISPVKDTYMNQGLTRLVQCYFGACGIFEYICDGMTKTFETYISGMTMDSNYPGWLHRCSLGRIPTFRPSNHERKALVLFFFLVLPSIYLLLRRVKCNSLNTFLDRSDAGSHTEDCNSARGVLRASP